MHTSILFCGFRNTVTTLLFLIMGLGSAFGQTCANLNFPAAIADSCQNSPFFCGNFLENYCGTNAGLSDDDFGQISGFLRLAPCEADMQLSISVSNCAPGGTGLIFQLYPDSCDASLQISSDTIFQNTTDTLIFNNLEILENYLLAISGLQGSQCEFNIQVLGGIGTALPGPVTCSCTNGGVSGPGKICTSAPVTYTLSIPDCFFSFGPPVGGNGEFCPTAEACPGSLDSFVLVWHIPSVMHFVGDSTGLEVEIALNANYGGLDTIRLDSIWVTYELISTQPVDSSIFCSCTSVACNGGIFKLNISIGRDIINYSCHLTCDQPTCIVDGIAYSAPGFYSYSLAPCIEVRVTVTQEEPAPIVFGDQICEGSNALVAVLNPTPGYTYQWSTGETGPFIFVSPGTTTQYQVSAVHFTGQCVYFGAATVTVLPLIEEFLGEVGVITCAQPCVTFQGQNYCAAGTYTVFQDQCWSQTFSIGSDPSLFIQNLPTVTICEGECYDFYGQSICISTTAYHTENCTTYVQTVVVGPAAVSNLGVVGSVSCAQPCFNFGGVNYCAVGQYSVQNSLCLQENFEIVFKKDEIDLGVIGQISCAQSCVTFEGNTYCQPGTYTVSDSCSIRSFTIGLNSTPPTCSAPFPDCLPSNTHFTVAFSIIGEPPFKVNGVSLNDSYFLSPPQPNGEDYAFIVEQSNGCQTIVTGTFDCSQLCSTDAGKLSEETLHGCAGQTELQVQSIVSPTLAPDDIAIFSLQTADGQLLSQNSEGVFGFDAATMSVEEVYFVTLNIGPPDATGLPDPNNACTDTSNQQPLVFHQLPNVSLSGDSSLCTGGMLLLMAEGAETYVWNDGTTGSSKEIAWVEEAQAGLYSVLGTDVWGCMDKDSGYVEVRPAQSEGCCKPQLPNAFTPNGDGANDSFTPILPDCNPLEFAEMRVYSRWGELVFQSTQKGDRWDGTTPNGNPASSDTYVFTYRYRLQGEEEQTQKGEVTLLR